MWNVHSYFVFVPLPLAVYLFYVHIYRAHQLLKSNVVFDCQRLPSLAYLFVKYFVEALRKKMGRLHARDVKGEAAITIINCRLDTKVLRRFCSAAGYGWDYPDSEYRDIPICFPEILCMRLVVMVISAEWFRLSPMGLFRVSQSVKTFQPIDELKKGAFVLQAHVIEYRLVDAGVEVDITLRAISRSSQPVWESVLTLLSHNQGKDQNKHPLSEFQADCLVSDNSKRGDICVPWTTGLKCIWTFSDYSPHCLLTIPAQLMGYKCPTTPSLWMLSKCLAEIEKHNGAEALRAPISLNVQFQNALVAPGKVVVKFWETTPEDRQSSRKDLSFQVSQPSASTEAPPHLTGQICRG